ncbi:chaperone protein TorD [Halalkaliarchaeum desulfuricum]|uniref:Chaperone protein TorD n=1 Tax=Halalkaliarchaeum desulfuricum TaxID=2055893 RepID=A0A343TFB4_9EURY|nr:molecular chaperone TorD family protein [Halalkaliarchaeum desulfuricum]AUX07786.1 chaperone protein TorD [Halalkaliarchaeum desulfuricum]AUX09528.1 chaperone protein TorD [Halalkaliarchaeum desulfuricum]
MTNPDATTEPVPELANSDDWAQLCSLLAECLKHPDERFFTDVEAGLLDTEIDMLVDRLDLPEPEGGPATELLPETVGSLDNEYIRLFEGLESPYAIPVESPYREWHAGTGREGLLEGPPADEMRRRYDALEAEIPAAYPPDHLALLLDYASVLLESGGPDEYRPFFRDHFDWLPAFQRLLETAEADAPFHRWCARLACEWIPIARNRLDLPEPTAGELDEMVERVDATASSTGVPDEKQFRE